MKKHNMVITILFSILLSQCLFGSEGTLVHSGKKMFIKTLMGPMISVPRYQHSQNEGQEYIKKDDILAALAKEIYDPLEKKYDEGKIDEEIYWNSYDQYIHLITKFKIIYEGKRLEEETFDNTTCFALILTKEIPETLYMIFPYK